MSSDSAANLGLGLGLRNVHFDYLLKHRPKVDWFEAISENFMDSGGRPRYVLDTLAEQYPIVLHGVSMSIGSTDPLDMGYLTRLKALADGVGARWISDHLCWTGVNGMNSHDLLPLPLNEATLAHVASRVEMVQQQLQQPLVLENPSSYLRFEQSDMDEPTFLSELVARTGCRLLLDVNNVYVSCFNQEADPYDYLRRFPMAAVVQFHLAGHSHCGTHIVDTHDRPVAAEVWRLYQLAYEASGGASTLLEWDGNIPALPDCLAELNKAKLCVTGLLETASAIGAPPQRSAVSTPVEFLVPDVRAQTRESV
ncbi:DUF692 domain-containing protein [Ferrimonas pelagia]|uniref:MNIO family bufferin maturase n=1 Tax=Ferrimonas pelagia TaxID=1177826 RepID=UPI0031E7F3BF